MRIDGRHSTMDCQGQTFNSVLNSDFKVDALMERSTATRSASSRRATACNSRPRTMNRNSLTANWLPSSGSRRRQSETPHGLGARGRVQREAASASRLRLCCDEPQQPGPDRRAHADPRGHGTGPQRTRQQPHGLCVAVSRAQIDVQMYTNDANALGYEMSRYISHTTAIQQEPTATQKIKPQSVSTQVTKGLSVG